MTCFRRVSFIALVIAFSFGGGASTAQTPGPARSPRLSVGVVRGDGILLPLASRESEAWTVLRSYVSDGDRGVYTLRDAPGVPREGWTAVAWDTGVSRPLAIMEMVTTDAYCARQEGFTTNAPKPAPKLEAPHLMSGIAIHGNVSAVRIEDMVRQPDPASRRVARFIVQLTHALESERTSMPPRSERRTVPLNDRGRVPVEITTLARDRVREAGHYYFEARKRYGAVEFYASGWLTSSPFSISVVRIDGGIYAGGETSRRSGRVLGVLRALQHSVWVMEMRGYEGDSYDIVEMPRGQVLSIPGGGC